MRARWGSITFGVVVHLSRSALILGGVAIAPLLGVRGWYAGLFVNVLCALAAAALVTHLRLWRSSGLLRARRGGLAMLALAPFVVEAVFRVVPWGLGETAPGVGWWALTLLLVGFNEELFSRGVVLDRLGRVVAALPAAAITGVLFGLQHLSLFATTSRGAVDILTNVLVSATYGFALAAFQWRFAWLWPLVVVHAVADFTTLLTARPFADVGEAVVSLCFVAYGWFLLRADPRRASTFAEVPAE